MRVPSNFPDDKLSNKGLNLECKKLGHLLFRGPFTFHHGDYSGIPVGQYVINYKFIFEKKSVLF